MNTTIPHSSQAIPPRIGVKNSATKKKKATVRAVRPVRPPSLMPDALSMKAVTGDVPNNEPTTLASPSTLKANMCLSNVCTRPHVVRGKLH